MLINITIIILKFLYCTDDTESESEEEEPSEPADTEDQDPIQRQTSGDEANVASKQCVAVKTEPGSRDGGVEGQAGDRTDSDGSGKVKSESEGSDSEDNT